MSPEKLTIYHEEKQMMVFSGTIKVGFNPSQLSLSSNVEWASVQPAMTSTTKPSGSLDFRSASPETLTLTLFFDTYATSDGKPELWGDLLGLAGATAGRPRSVVAQTGAVVALTRFVQELHRPPVCQLKWGKQLLFQGVLQRASRTYTLFLDDGTPVRATMECSFLEFPGEGTAATELYSADVTKKHVVRPGDTLMGIAAALYGDGSRWRAIAEANRIEDPRRLVPGQTLTIPRIR